MVVYVVVGHEWSHSWLVGVYSSRNLAEAAVEEELGGKEEDEGEYYDICVKPVQ